MSRAHVLELRLLLVVAIFLIVSPARRPDAQVGTGSVQGVVLDGDGTPLSGAIVFAVPTNNLGKQFHTSSDAAGHFTLSGLPEGDAYLQAYKESAGHPYNFFAFFQTPGEKTPDIVHVKTGETAKGAVIQLGERSARLNLEVDDENGNLLTEGIGVTFTRPDQPGRPYSTSAHSKESLLVPPVPFGITIIAKGYKDYRYGTGPGENKDGLLRLKSGETKDLFIRLQPLR